MDGEYVIYDSMGGLEKKCGYRNGTLHGDYEEYGRHGKLSKKCGYLDGKLHGPYYDEEYDYKERPAIYCIQECHYHCGMLDGPYKIYNELSDGSLILYHESFYIGGKLHGVIKEYNRVDGSLEDIAHFKHGKPHGSYSRFKKGVLVEYKMWNHGKPHGTYMTWDTEGNLTKHEVYRNGVMITE